MWLTDKLVSFQEQPDVLVAVVVACSAEYFPSLLNVAFACVAAYHALMDALGRCHVHGRDDRDDCGAEISHS